jgi:tRNA (cytidine/uridine-2'-O-)-methyltransferase
MFNIILYQPEIPPNTGNIIRLCANTGCTLHLIKPLGFALEDKQLRRAGLDYHEWANVLTYDALADCLAVLPTPQRVFAFSTKGARNYNEQRYQAGDAFLFGPETKGLPSEVLNSTDVTQVVRLPMKENSRSLNLSNVVSIAIYEAWRQSNFCEAKI